MGNTHSRWRVEESVQTVDFKTGQSFGEPQDPHSTCDTCGGAFYALSSVRSSSFILDKSW
jgi:hypothetical protein